MNELPLHENFRAEALDARLKWFNPPKRWRLEAHGPGLVIEPESSTDFWQRTHYGFSADNGHFLGLTLRGNFVLSTQVSFHPLHQYDQAGLMVRADADFWVKASVEHEPHGQPQLGTVVTNHGYSDWSLQDYPFTESTIRLRIIRHGADLQVEFAEANSPQWAPMRVARLHWPEQAPVCAGLYACSPKEAGFRAEFAFLKIEIPTPPTAQP